MKWTRALWIGIVAYFASMILGLLVNSLMGFTMEAPDNLPSPMWVISLVVLFSVGMGTAWWYFSGKHTYPNLLHGLYLGLIIVVVGFIFDVLTVGLFYLGGDMPTDYTFWDMYMQIWFWIASAVMVATTTLVGWYRSRK